MQLTVLTEHSGITEQELIKKLRGAGIKITSASVIYEGEDAMREFHFKVVHRAHHDDVQAPPVVEELATLKHVLKVSWQP